MALDLRAERPTAPAPVVVHDDQPALGYQAALDGIRGLAVLGVLCFHNGFGWATGGFLGVSTFFTLSGFLITTLLLDERRRTGRVRLREFWARRFRRLMPAALLTLGGVLVFGATVATGDQLRALRGDVWSALGYVANWRFIVDDRSYAELFSAPSPVQHFWSLAIEEQFYVGFPLLVVGLLAVFRGSRRALGTVFAVLIGLSVLASLMLYEPGADNLRVYYSSGTRAAELLVGALLAVVMLRRTRLEPGPTRIAVSGAGVVALAVTLWVWTTASISDAWLYRGGFAIYALGSAALIAAALQPSWLRRLLSVTPLVMLGLISYGVYLIHWPVFLWLTESRTGLTGWRLFTLRFAVTLVLAILSYRLLELPVRRGYLVRGFLRPAAATLGIAVLVVGTLFVTSDLPARDVTLVAGTVESAPVRVTVVGDQLARSLVPGLKAWDDGKAVVDDQSFPGCSFARSTAAQIVANWQSANPACDSQSDRWPAAIQQFGPDVIVVFTGVGEVAERQLSAQDVGRAPGDPELDRWLTAELASAADVLLASGVPVVWLTTPELEPEGHPQTDPARVARFNELVRTVAEDRPNLTVVDTADGLESISVVGLERGRRAEVGDWLAPKLRDVAESERKELPVPERTDPLTEVEVGPGPVVPPLTVAPGETPRLMVVGDSFAVSVGYGLNDFAARTGAIEVGHGGRLGCPIARGGRYRFLEIDTPIDDATCDWTRGFPQWVAENNPHAFLLMTGVWEIADRLLPGDTTWRRPGDPVLDNYVQRELFAAVDMLGASGARVVLATYPYVNTGQDLGKAPGTFRESDPERMDRLNDMLREVAAARPAFVTLIDLQAFFEQHPGGQLNPAIRPDGVHPSDEFSRVIADWLAPQILDLIPKG